MEYLIMFLSLMGTCLITILIVIELLGYLVNIQYYVLNEKERKKLYKNVLIKMIIFTFLVTVFYKLNLLI